MTEKKGRTRRKDEKQVEDAQAITKTVSELMKKYGIRKQADLAEKMGVSRQIVNRLCNYAQGKKGDVISRQDIPKLFEALNLDSEDYNKLKRVVVQLALGDWGTKTLFPEPNKHVESVWKQQLEVMNSISGSVELAT